MEGRDPTRKNASLNGLYAPVEGGFAGVSAFEKVGSATAPRFLFYFAKKNRWKISEDLGDEKGGFAFMKVKDGGQTTPSNLTDQHWHVFDSKGEGYNEDPEVRCARLENSTEAKHQEKKKAKHEPTAQRQEARAANGAAASSASSGSSADSDGDDASSASSGTCSSSGSEDEAAGQPNADQARPISLGTAGPDDQERQAAPRSSPRPAGLGQRVCAKMLVRSGLRCGCHFSYARECPSVRAAGPAALVA